MCWCVDVCVKFGLVWDVDVLMCVCWGLGILCPPLPHLLASLAAADKWEVWMQLHVYRLPPYLPTSLPPFFHPSVALSPCLSLFFSFPLSISLSLTHSLSLSLSLSLWVYLLFACRGMFLCLPLISHILPWPWLCTLMMWFPSTDSVLKQTAKLHNAQHY